MRHHYKKELILGDPRFAITLFKPRINHVIGAYEDEICDVVLKFKDHAPYIQFTNETPDTIEFDDLKVIWAVIHSTFNEETFNEMLAKQFVAEPITIFGDVKPEEEIAYPEEPGDNQSDNNPEG